MLGPSRRYNRAENKAVGWQSGRLGTSSIQAATLQVRRDDRKAREGPPPQMLKLGSQVYNFQN